jgi:hypothetical protein
MRNALDKVTDKYLKGQVDSYSVPLEKNIPGVDFPSTDTFEVYLAGIAEEDRITGGCITNNPRDNYSSASVIMMVSEGKLKLRISEKLPELKKFAEQRGYTLREDSKYLLHLEKNNDQIAINTFYQEYTTNPRFSGTYPGIVVTSFGSKKPESAVKEVKTVIDIVFSEGFTQDLANLRHDMNEAGKLYKGKTLWF